MMPRRIRLFWTVGAVLAVLMVAGVAAAVLVPRLLPLGDEGSLYRRYRNMPGIEATYLKDYPINDTLNVDVTTLRATDDEGWETLTADFNIPKLPEFMQEKIDAGKDIVSVRLTPKTAPGQPMDTTDLLKNNVIGISRKNHTISIFNTDTKEQQEAVAHYNYRKGY